MTAHISILPLDVLDTLTRQLEDRAKVTNAGQSPSSLRFLRLPHPRTSVPSLFLPYETSPSSMLSTGTAAFRYSILELQSVAPPNPRSWFLGEDEVIGDGKLLMMTPVDPAFLLLPIMRAAYPTQDDGDSGAFRPLDDIFEDAATKLVRSSLDTCGKDTSAVVTEKDVMHLLQLDCVCAAVNSVCESKELTPEITVYRYSPEKVLEHLRPKVARLSMPQIMDRSRTIVRGLAKEGLMDDGKEDLLESGRTRAACELLSQYLPQDTYTALLSSYSFTALDAFLQTQRNSDAAALAAADANSVGGKGAKKVKAGDGGKDAEGSGKKRKGASQGVEKLKKVNVDGMKKISSFFGGKG